MTLGNFAALTSKSVTRILAYSSIGQAGYILVGFAAGGCRANGVLLSHFELRHYAIGSFSCRCADYQASLGRTI